LTGTVGGVNWLDEFSDPLVVSVEEAFWYRFKPHLLVIAETGLSNTSGINDIIDMN